MTILFAGFVAGQFETLNTTWPVISQSAGWFRTPAQCSMTMASSSTDPAVMPMIRIPAGALPASGAGILQFGIGSVVGAAPVTPYFLRLGNVALARANGAPASSASPLVFRQVNADGSIGAAIAGSAGVVCTTRITVQIVFTKTTAALYVENELKETVTFVDNGQTDIIFSNHLASGTAQLSEVILSDEVTYKRAKLGAFFLVNALLTGTSTMTGNGPDLMTPRITTGVGGNAQGQIADISLNAPLLTGFPGTWGARKLFLDYRTDNPDFPVRFSYKLQGTDPSDVQIAIEPVNSGAQRKMVEIAASTALPTRMFFRLE